MRNLAIRAVTRNGFRLTLDLSGWAAVGVDLSPAIIRAQVSAQMVDGAQEDAAPVLEFVTGAANPVTFDPLTGLAVLAAPATATGLSGVFDVAARAEFSNAAVHLFGGTLTFVPGVSTATPAVGLPSADTAWVAAHPFGPAPAPAALSTAVASAQEAARAAIVRSLVFG